ncbi:NAD(P)/FAD-dependent oxidoreductase [Streptomyces morookaense]|uniref:FAD-dependent oxidoreductase n=1 Tax=Streptomyces morookaense TaxID=1970 RepID=UPI0033D30CF8
MKDTTTPHVIVIGGGTGGLCLAHGLKRAGVSVRVYERDRTRADGVQGYRVGIDPDGSRALKACLSPDLFDTFVATCARTASYFCIRTEQLKESLTLELHPPTDPVNSEKSVSRMTLRQVLVTGVEDVVEFGKVFTHYEQNDDGTVTAFFEDGTSATGDVLVAADGSNSRVRRQYLPHATVQEAGVIAVTCKVPLTDESRALLPKEVTQGIGLVMAPRGYTCILHTMEFPWDREGELKHGIGNTDAELIKNWPGLLYDNTRDYINWGFNAATRQFPSDVMQMRGKELIDLVLRMTPGWAPQLHQLFRMGDPSTCFPIKVHTTEPVPQWRTTNVTLLGDAIHTMTPGMGVGANTALRDAALLTKNLTAVSKGSMTLHDAVHDYETQMVEYGFKAVLDSRKNFSGDQVVHRDVLGRVALVGMRAGLWALNHLPPAKRKMADKLYEYRGGERE